MSYGILLTKVRLFRMINLLTHKEIIFQNKVFVMSRVRQMGG